MMSISKSLSVTTIILIIQYAIIVVDGFLVHVDLRTLPHYRPVSRISTSTATTTTRTNDAFHGDENDTNNEVTRRRATATRTGFEYQELRANLDAMKRQNVSSRDLDAYKRQEIEKYVRHVITYRPSSSDDVSQLGELLPGRSYRLAFSTESAALGDLPRDAQVFLRFKDRTTMEYSLEFSEKTLGLNSIKAISNWTIDSKGLVTFIYDRIVLDAFGFKNVGIGFFGLLKGRANFVETAYFDDDFWIERAVGLDGTSDYLNVYFKEEDKDVWKQ
jgi:hypothetical protein